MEFLLTVGDELGSTAVKAEAWHHRSDAITPAAAFLGISITLIGGHGWESADDWAAIAAAGIIFFNGTRILRPAVADLMDRAPDPTLLHQVATAARSTEGVHAIEKLKMRKAGLGYFVEVHVQTDPDLSLYKAHILGGRVKSAIRDAVPSVLGVLVHMEPYLEARVA
jgi:cation diffusion facilitator family transporter